MNVRVLIFICIYFSFPVIFGGNRQFGRVFVKLDEIGRRIGRVLDQCNPWYDCVSHKTL